MNNDAARGIAILMSILLVSFIFIWLSDSFLFAIDLVYGYGYTIKEAREIVISYKDGKLVDNITMYIATRIFVPIVYAFKKATKWRNYNE